MLARNWRMQLGSAHATKRVRSQKTKHVQTHTHIHLRARKRTCTLLSHQVRERGDPTCQICCIKVFWSMWCTWRRVRTSLQAFPRLCRRSWHESRRQSHSKVAGSSPFSTAAEARAPFLPSRLLFSSSPSSSSGLRQTKPSVHAWGKRVLLMGLSLVQKSLVMGRCHGARGFDNGLESWGKP